MAACCREVTSPEVGRVFVAARRFRPVGWMAILEGHSRCRGLWRSRGAGGGGGVGYFDDAEVGVREVHDWAIGDGGAEVILETGELEY